MKCIPIVFRQPDTVVELDWSSFLRYIGLLSTQFLPLAPKLVYQVHIGYGLLPMYAMSYALPPWRSERVKNCIGRERGERCGN